MTIYDVDLSWTNYVQLACTKRIPEFVQSVIVLDHDVLTNNKTKSGDDDSTVVLAKEAKNIVFLPLTVERDFFILLKQHKMFNLFRERLGFKDYNYDICFRDYTADASEYDSLAVKNWFASLLDVVDEETLYAFWISLFPQEANKFINDFIQSFNQIAEMVDTDTLPCSNK